MSDALLRRRQRTLPIILTVAIVGFIGLTGAHASHAVLIGEVPMPTTTAGGSSLTITGADGRIAIRGPAIRNLKPGSSSTSEFSVGHSGPTGTNLTFVASPGQGTDDARCFDYTLRDRTGHVLVATGSLSRDMTAPLGRSAPGMTRIFRLTVTTRGDCDASGATGGLTADIVARQ